MHWPRKHEVVGLNPELISLPPSGYDLSAILSVYVPGMRSGVRCTDEII